MTKEEKEVVEWMNVESEVNGLEQNITNLTRDCTNGTYLIRLVGVLSLSVIIAISMNYHSNVNRH